MLAKRWAQKNGTHYLLGFNVTEIKFAAPRCAVFLAVHNGMQYVEEQLQTILNQTGVSLMVFVSIDVSSDGSETWFKELANQDARVNILAYGERFGGAAKNFFRLIREVDFSSFQYIAFADQDDLWFPNKLATAISHLKDFSYDAYSSSVIAFWPNGKKKLINKAQPQRQWDYIFEAAGPGCTYVFNNQLLKAIKKRLLETWEEAQRVNLHDWYCYAFARNNGYKWFIDSQPSMFYRQHGKNQVGVNLGMKAYLSRFKQMRSGKWFNQACLIANLVGSTHNAFVAKWSGLKRWDLLRLSSYAFKCRRCLHEQIVFMVLCLMLAMTGID